MRFKKKINYLHDLNTCFYSQRFSKNLIYEVAIWKFFKKKKTISQLIDSNLTLRNVRKIEEEAHFFYMRFHKRL